ncbi:Endo-1-4-beta-xylanase D [Penicillium diatomitis]|uniref:Beta-xylanase n=1 Tax=Penicillium diatomitis TaxID=2819901 RepID=A0A9W9X359_9EURO|nr:Endo-1-4-beta-xylanase D [Penicillium diatomitis]KAJ5483033.1 Endo-1-4-beta-xylanase D [Penicillium diatomitis]
MVHLSASSLLLAAGILPNLALGAGLNDAAVSIGQAYFGSATDNPELSDSTYVKQLSNTADFGQITPGNSQKWDATEPSRNVFTYSGGDTVAKLAQSNGQKLRCHNLVWHSQLPSWVTSGNFNNATLISIMKNHITNLVQHYKGQCYAWDVVNEALNEDGTYRQSVWYNTIGPAYIPIAFATAASVDPDVKLYYNDYNIEYSGAKAGGARRIVELVQSYGAKIDGVGLQSHFIVGSTPSKADQKTTMAGYTAYGVDVAITELDIRMTLPSTNALLTQQATDYSNTVAACVETKKCVGVTIWDWTDKYSWVPNTFPGQGAACPWDSNYQKKPAYNAILSALNAGGSSSGGGSTTTTTAAVTTTTSASGSGPTGGSGVAQQWGQCGGNGWTGPTTCVSGTTCKYSNPWYSQCL